MNQPRKPHAYGPSHIHIVGSGDRGIVEEHAIRHRSAFRQLKETIKGLVNRRTGEILTVEEVADLEARADREDQWAKAHELALAEYDKERQAGEVYGKSHKP